MTDWKDALQALSGQHVKADDSTPTKNVERKKRVGVVYSTNPNFAYEDEKEYDITTLPNNQQKLRVSIEKAGRAGKTVTLINGFVGTQADMGLLCKRLKQHCGVGGSVKDNVIIIQGDHKQKVLDILKKEDYTQSK